VRDRANTLDQDQYCLGIDSFFYTDNPVIPFESKKLFLTSLIRLSAAVDELHSFLCKMDIVCLTCLQKLLGLELTILTDKDLGSFDELLDLFLD
jgi:hypothetical protein